MEDLISLGSNIYGMQNARIAPHIFCMSIDKDTVSRLGDPSPEAVGVRLRAIMDMNGLTQGEFGKRIGTTTSVVGNWVRGYATPRSDSLLKIRDQFNVSIDFLVGGYLGHFSMDQLDQILPALSKAHQQTLIDSQVRTAREQLKKQHVS